MNIRMNGYRKKVNSKVIEESINVSKTIPHGKSCLEIFVEKLRI